MSPNHHDGIIVMSRLFTLEPAYAVDHFDYRGWYAAEIPSGGMRALWDGGLSREFPRPAWDWGASTPSGLFTSHGYVIPEEDDFLDIMPPYPLDGFIYEEDGQTCFSAFAIPHGGSLLQTGQVFTGQRFFDISPDAIFDMTMTSPRCGLWKSPSEPCTINEEVSLAATYLDLGRVHYAKYREIQSLGDLDPEGAYLIRSPYASWSPEFHFDWVTTAHAQSVAAKVLKVSDQGLVSTTAGDLTYLKPGPFHVGDPVRVFLNHDGFVTGVEKAKLPVVQLAESVRGEPS